MKKTIIILLTIIILAAVGISLYYVSAKSHSDATLLKGGQNLLARNDPDPGDSIMGSMNFVAAAKVVTPSVVHIKITLNTAGRSGSLQLYGSSEIVPAMASGSGVIIDPNGYIATNNHVVENATKIEVVLPDRREFTAKLVGRDPNTDLALIKINATGLPVIKWGNSDNVQVGQWVLAVGYPFSLNTTVTAGIISAKERSIGIINSAATGSASNQGNAVEAFIQTDAAINPGNSGGALVNTRGELIGINAAIASMTGSYSGYAFAIPVNLAKKILDDLKEFGTVKRGILGVAFPAPETQSLYLKQQGIAPGSIKGVLITNIQTGSAAAVAGLQKGDIIQSIDGVQLFSSEEFSERIARHRPGDKITLTYLRDGKPYTVTVTLKGEEDTKNLANTLSLEEIYKRLGATFSPLTPALKQRFNLKAGVVVTEVRDGGFFDQLGIPAGTVIVYINGKAINNPKDIEEAFVSAQNRRVQILAIAPDGSRVSFNFSLGT